MQFCPRQDEGVLRQLILMQTFLFHAQQLKYINYLKYKNQNLITKQRHDVSLMMCHLTRRKHRDIRIKTVNKLPVAKKDLKKFKAKLFICN